MAALFRPPQSHKQLCTNHANQFEQLKELEDVSSDEISNSDAKEISQLHVNECNTKSTMESKGSHTSNIDDEVATRTSHINIPMWYTSHIQLIVRHPAFLLILLASFCITSAFLATAIHSTYQATSKGFSLKKASTVLTAMGCGGLFGRIIQGWLIDTNCLRSTSLYEVSLLIAAGASFLNPVLDSYAGFVVCAIVIGMAGGIIFPLLFPIVREMIGVAMLATATGLIFFAEGCGSLAGSYLAGMF